MPTTIWILETAEERFWEGSAALPPPRYFSCPYCDRQFGTFSEVENHIRLSHLLDLPALLLRGNQVPAEGVIRIPMLETEVQLANCTSCQVRIDAGETKTLSAMEFRRLFARQRYAHWDIHLINSYGSASGQSERKYRLDFRVPERCELDEADHFFIRYLAVDRPKHKDIDLFNARCRIGPSARDYMGALVNYVLGVMIKEQEADLVAPLAFDEYKAKFLAARTVLREFHRPVALAITLCIDFNLNGFTAEQRPSRLYWLDAGHNLFHAIAQVNNPSPSPPDGLPRYSAPVCPVDTVTDGILSACERYMRGARLSVDIARELSDFPRTRSVSEYDIPKLHVLCALIYLGLGNRGEAEIHLRHIQFDSLFGNWARRKLEEGE